MFSWSKRPTTGIHEKSRRVGLDLTASRLRGVVSGPANARLLGFDDPESDLRLYVSLAGRTPEVGRIAGAQVKRTPHLVCSNFLAHVGQPRSWSGARFSLSAEAALGASFAKVGPFVAQEAEAIGLVLPGYLTPPQAVKIAAAATGNKLPVAGTAASALAIAADRASVILEGRDARPNDAEERPAGIVPIRSESGGPGSVVVVDADDHGLTGSVVWIDRGEVRLLLSATWPKLAIRLWKDRLLDAVSDRCVRQCRRDPRDSAEAEQALYDQLEPGLAATRGGRSAAFSLRSAHWYQDVILQPHDFDVACAALTAHAITNLTELIYSSGVPTPPRAIWLTDTVSLLPGLSASIYQNSAESTEVHALPFDAVAVAAANLAPRWLNRQLPRTHLDSVIPLTVASEHESPAGRIAAPIARPG